MTVADRLERVARDYETRAVHEGDQGDAESAHAFQTVAVVLYEIAKAIDGEDDELEAA